MDRRRAASPSTTAIPLFPYDSSLTHGPRLLRRRRRTIDWTRSTFFILYPIPMTSPEKNTSPAFHVLQISKGGFSTKIGAAWPSKSGKAINVVLDCIPLDGRFCLVKPKPKPTV